MNEAELAVQLETRHVRDAFKAMPVKTDRKDARGMEGVPVFHGVRAPMAGELQALLNRIIKRLMRY
jgi:hypothetical protein